MKSLSPYALLLALAFPAAAQSVPAADYTDLWWNPQESGWGLSFAQHSGPGRSDQVLAVWYTYDPRAPETATAGSSDFKPLWIVMPGGTWTSPTSITGSAYVTSGSPFASPWNNAAFGSQAVGTFTIRFSSASTGVFSYDIAAPAGLPETNPAYGLTPAAGSRPIQRQVF